MLGIWTVAPRTVPDRRAATRAATRADILGAAWDVARAAGFGSLTLREVAARVGMRAPSLYTHFGSKLAIVDAMFEQGWSEYLAALDRLEAGLPEEPRRVMAATATQFFDFAVADPVRYQLLNHMAVPGFAPSADAYRPAVEALDRLAALLRRCGVTDPAGIDLATAMIGGLVDQQLANDPGGDRWRRLIDRANDMLADELGVPGRRLTGPPNRTDSPDRSDSPDPTGRTGPTDRPATT